MPYTGKLPLSGETTMTPKMSGKHALIVVPSLATLPVPGRAEGNRLPGLPIVTPVSRMRTAVPSP